ncbi:hypothetical protein BJ322DRAFT_775798 [Thelephora terrestris]|uniref:Uncharacterized protein n=1 Tax=Thelephora terrestris TaxID=56493 RepID=A0A9P6HFN6_9AGAM|nr:hypothetical protein BJ322DRAFT_775798 [Thelephora terrestris]
MADTEELPGYTVIDPESNLVLGPPPPHDDTDFTIGSQRVSHPLVSIENLKSHLRLLGMFALMKQKVEDPDSDPQVMERIPPLAKALPPEWRWVWFLELAVERFERWAASLNVSGGLFVLPPIDVWMIWHAYMLNPIWYAEDCERLPLLRALRNLKDHPIDLMESIGDDPFDFRPPPEQEEFWDAQIRLPYNPFVSCRVHTHVEISCPRCEGPVSVPFLNAGKSGFAQTDFNVVCGDCSSLATREKLGVAKFTRDAVLDPDDPAHISAYGKAVYLPGTLLMTSGQINTVVAKETKVKLKRVDAFRNDQDGRPGEQFPYPDTEAWRNAMGEKLKYEASELRRALEGCLTASRARRIAGAYVDGRPFSVQLVAAAMRQARFTEKMRQLGWLNPGFFDSTEDVETLKKCVTRYYGFLTLIQDIGSFSVPTLDIDLVWHTHQLSPKAYKKDCTLYVGKFVNHDDEVEASFLSDGFELTCRAWESRFGMDYSRCGCSLPGTTLGQRLRRLRKKVLSHRPRAHPPMDPEDCYSASHPSDHNSVSMNARVRKQRREAWKPRWQRRRNRDGQKIKNSKGQMQNGDLEERHPRGQDQDAAPVVAPLPLMYGYGYPYESSESHGMCLGDMAGCSGCEGSSSCSSMA